MKNLREFRHLVLYGVCGKRKDLSDDLHCPSCQTAINKKELENQCAAESKEKLSKNN